MSDERYKVRWYGVNCRGYFGRTFEDKEDAEMFAQRWLLDCILGNEGIHEDYFNYEVVSFFPYKLATFPLNPSMKSGID